MSTQPEIDEYFASFGARLARIARAQGVEVEPPEIGSTVAAEVLALAGTVAHMSERKSAPLATFLAGIVVGRLEAAGQLGSGDEVATFVRQLRKELEA